MVPMTTAYSFGALATDTSKTTDGNVSFRIGLLNAGNDTLEVDMSHRGLENGEVHFPDQIRLEPSRISSESKPGWISVGPDRYVKPRWINFYVETTDSSDDEFSVLAEARKPGISSAQIAPRIVQVREFAYTLDYTKERFSKGEQDSQNAPELFQLESQQDEQNKSEKDKQNVIIGTQRTESKNEGENGSGVATPVLLAIAAVSIIYLWRSL
ncbi:hypothetical protein [Candidatus Nanohalococcus occultus]|uniref:hypothetical protein n=1 Tax=Candidatus Nanohalococcus occultus TaxID=2978047 RepID=UPI0039E1ECFC